MTIPGLQALDRSTVRIRLKEPDNNFLFYMATPASGVVAREVIDQVHAVAKRHERILVCLDSNHTHAHVLAELEAYAPFTSKGSYCIVFDTIIEDLPADMFPDRPWTVGDTPKTAVAEYLRLLKAEGRKGLDGQPLDFEVDRLTEDKLLLTASPSGYLRRL